MADPFHIGFPTAEQLANAKGKTGRWLVEHADHQSDECLEWPYSKMRFGYGHFNFERKFYPAHRMMCWLRHGAPPSSEHVAAHSCGNPACVNPEHLRWATQLENSADQSADGTLVHGVNVHSSFMSEREVRAIRRLHACGMRQNRIADAFDVSKQRVNEIVLRKVWKHLGDG